MWWNLPTRVQVLDLARVLTLFWIYSRIFRRYALSGKRRSRRQRGANGDFGNLQICRSSFGGAHRGRVCVRVFIEVSVRAYCERLCCTVLKKVRQVKRVI